MGFTGIVGHEFVGVVEKIEASENDDEGARLASSALLGKRVVGEINLGERQRRQKRREPPFRGWTTGVP